MKTYRFTIDGTDADGQSWQCVGVVTCEWIDVSREATKIAFQDLTQGKAIYGNPGKGCRGPYNIEYMEVIQI